MKTTWQKYRRRLLLVGCSIIFGLLLVEGALRLLAVAGPDQLTQDLKGLAEYTIPDPALTIKVKPNAPGHDAWGFRNAAVPDHADVVAIGDSQTWGINAQRNDAWPQTLARLSGDSVYNMALGYYGPVEYWVLVKQALKLHPKDVVIGLYFGNDIWGAYNTVYTNNTYTYLRNPSLEAAFKANNINQKYNELAQESQATLPWIQHSFITKFAAFCRRHSFVLQLIWRTWENVNHTQFKSSLAWAKANPQDGVIYENGNVKMILQPTFRLLALDQSYPSNVEGLRITEEMLSKSQQEVEAAGSHLIILFIPTQELASADAVRAVNGSLNLNYTKLVAAETTVRNDVIAYCDENGIGYADALPALRTAINNNEVVYPPYADGHPVAAGYKVIASVVNDYLKSH